MISKDLEFPALGEHETWKILNILTCEPYWPILEIENCLFSRPWIVAVEIILKRTSSHALYIMLHDSWHRHVGRTQDFFVRMNRKVTDETRRNCLVRYLCLERSTSQSFPINQPPVICCRNNVEHISIIFSKPEKRTNWEETFLEAKARLSKISKEPENVEHK